MKFNTRDINGVQNRGLTIEFGNQTSIQGTTGAVDCLNDQVSILGTSVATMQTSPTYPDNSNKLATTSFVTSAISNNNNLFFRGY